MTNSGTESNPIKTDFDPCPSGWRVPTYIELHNAISPCPKLESVMNVEIQIREMNMDIIGRQKLHLDIHHGGIHQIT